MQFPYRRLEENCDECSRERKSCLVKCLAMPPSPSEFEVIHDNLLELQVGGLKFHYFFFILIKFEYLVLNCIKMTVSYANNLFKEMWYSVNLRVVKVGG